MEPWQIIIYTLAALLLLYFIGMVYAWTTLASFRSKLKKQVDALAILFSEKKDILLSLYALYDEANVPLEKGDKTAAAKVRWLKTDSITDNDVENITHELNALENRLTLLSESESYIKLSEDFQTYTATLKDLDSNYHRIVAIYDSDLLGYDYWRKFPLYFLLFALFGFRKKKRLN